MRERETATRCANAVHRREFLAFAGAALFVPGARVISQEGVKGMYGLIGKMTVAPGQRDTVIDTMLAGTTKMPGCLSYIIAKDPSDPNGIWVTEVWDNEASHKASLSLSEVQATIAKVKPLIAGFAERFITTPVGGVGLR